MFLLYMRGKDLAARLIIGITILYFITRIYFFFVFQKGFLDAIFAAGLLLAEFFMMTQSIGFVLNIIRLSKLGRKKIYHQKRNLDVYPNVAVAVAVRHEDSDMVEKSIITLKSLDYPNKKIYLLDGSSDENFINANKKIADKYSVNYFHPKELHGAKAGTINDFLDNIFDKYLAIFDVDQNPMPNFLMETIKIAETDESIAFVQTPQLYSNIGISPIAKGAALQQSIFYESICEAKGMSNAMFCCGSNVLFRTQCLKSVGGFEEEFITEDFATSVKLHAKGYKSVYYNHACAFGMAPETLPAYFKQQSRWAAGTISVLKSIIKSFFKNPRALKLNQWWEYFLSGSYYLMGWMFFVLMVSPIVYLLFSIPSYFMNPYVYLGLYLPYVVLSSLVFYSTMRGRNYNGVDIYYGVILGLLSFPALMIAAVKGFFYRKLEFVVTPKNINSPATALNLSPWILMISLNVLAIIVGLSRINHNSIYAISINIVWCLYHIFVLSYIFRLNKPAKVHESFLNLK